MLRSLNSLLGATLHARDGDLGHITDFLFDDRGWVVRYLAVETGSWLASRGVLISPSAAQQPDWDKRAIAVNLTMDQVRNSPPVDTAKPVSRQMEISMSRYYGWPAYWSLEYPILEPDIPIPAQEAEGDPYLRSTREVSSYKVQALDGDIGTIEDLIMDDANWFIRYLLVNTGSWLSGQKVMLPARSIGAIMWSNRLVKLAQSRDEL